MFVLISNTLLCHISTCAYVVPAEIIDLTLVGDDEHEEEGTDPPPVDGELPTVIDLNKPPPRDDGNDGAAGAAGLVA